MVYLLLGECPPPTAPASAQQWLSPSADCGSTASRLRDLAGWSDETFLSTFAWRTNVVSFHVVKWDVQLRKYAFDKVTELIQRAISIEMLGVVCLGRHAMRAVTEDKVAPMRWYTVPDSRGYTIQVAYLPHTSGRCRFWNNYSNRARGKEFLAALLKTVPSMVTK